LPDPIVPIDATPLNQDQANVLANNVLIQGAVMQVWWARQSSSFQGKFMDAINISLQNGESTQQATTRIFGGTIDGVAVPGVMRGTRKQAETLARTAINEVVTQTRLRTFQEMDDVVSGLQQISTLDGRTSDICIAYSGQMWDVETLEPINGSTLPYNDGTPRHFNCRSSIVPILRSFDELGINATEVPLADRASMDGKVPGDISFADWLRTKSQSFQDDLLGPSRARMWRNGDITLTQLVDMRGNPMTLDQLESIGP